MDGAKSGPGVFYQVMPGVTPDGKKVMKLIPGVMVNGKFVQTPGIQGLQASAAPQKLLPLSGSPASTNKKMVLDPPFTQQVINKVSLLNSTSSQASVKVNNVPNKQLAPQKYILVNQPLADLETAVPAVPMVIKAQSLPRGRNVQLQNQKYFILKQPPVSTATVSAVNEKPQFLSQPPVTVKSVALPRVIPPNTKNQTVPVSELSAVIKKQLPTSTRRSVSGSDPSSGLPSSVTPITTAKQNAAPPSLKQPIQPSHKYFPGPELQGATKQLKLVQKAPRGHNGPCKWVIEEVDTAAPEDPPPVTPETPSALAGKVEPNKHGATAPGPDPNSRPSRSMSGRSDAVMVCNGKVFVVAKKSNDSSVTHELSKPLPKQREKEQDSSGGTPGQLMDVIDLCEDDDNGLSTSSQDDDNVIFVSYVPPKPGAPDLQVAEQRSKLGNCAVGSDLQVPRRSPDRRGDNDLCGLAEVFGSRSSDAMKHAKPSQQEVVEEEKEPAVEDMVEEVVAEEVLEEEEVVEQVVAEVVVKEKSKVKDMVQAEVVEEAVQEEHTIGGTETSRAVVFGNSQPPPSPTPTSDRGSDRQLRQMFNITADVRILLQRVDDPSARFQVSSLNLCNPSGSLLLRGEAPQKQSAATTAHVACLHSSRNSLTCGSLPRLPPGTYEVAEAANFLEPIEEDFLSEDENQGHNGTWQPTSSTSRGGRTRKRPRCPCCIPGSGVPAAKSRWSEVEPVAVRRSWKTNRQKTDKRKLDSE